MLPNQSLCFKRVGSPCCQAPTTKYGKSPQGKQRYRCTTCGKTHIKNYSYKAYHPNLNTALVALLKEGVGILGMARILNISPTTVLNRIRHIAAQIKPPPLAYGKTYEVDELRTFVSSKRKGIWLVCAFCRESKRVVRYKVGPRTNKTLRHVITSLQLAAAKNIYTDKLKNYQWLVPKKIHKTKKHSTNHIERFHLSIRTHLKRLNRRTICFSRSAVMLSATVKIYLWETTLRMS